MYVRARVRGRRKSIRLIPRLKWRGSRHRTHDEKVPMLESSRRRGHTTPGSRTKATRRVGTGRTEQIVSRMARSRRAARCRFRSSVHAVALWPGAVPIIVSSSIIIALNILFTIVLLATSRILVAPFDTLRADHGQHCASHHVRVGER